MNSKFKDQRPKLTLIPITKHITATEILDLLSGDTGWPEVDSGWPDLESPIENTSAQARPASAGVVSVNP